MILKSDRDLISNFRGYISNQRGVIIFSPYIKEIALNSLVRGFENRVSAIITTWKPLDIVLGITDLSVYPYCRTNGIKLLINNKIHLKSILSDDFESCIISSSNVTNKGLAISKAFNYELGTIEDSITVQDKLYFDEIIESSTLVDDCYYKIVQEQIQMLPPPIENIPSFFQISLESENPYLSSNLPYYEYPERLFDVVQNQKHYSDDDVRNVFHDLRLYNCMDVKNQHEMFHRLSLEFRRNAFIKQFLEYNGDGKYFGELTEWLHKKIENVPAPKRYEVKEFLVRILRYIDYLFEDEYEIIIPKSHSQFLRRKI